MYTTWTSHISYRYIKKVKHRNENNKINNYSKITKNKNKMKRWTNAMKSVEINKIITSVEKYK